MFTMQATISSLLKDTDERILVFAGSVAAANTAARALEEVGVSVLLYHKEVPAAKRADALRCISQWVSANQHTLSVLTCQV